ncbi:hypothetical protein PLICRDRAFT_41874 [Plicaturopsis crispa FD-325 SS-3]|nr:hypothetical protein PLICRDRAFT_41874 [Plicaturopsis crispa FD-325 SS-3]
MTSTWRNLAVTRQKVFRSTVQSNKRCVSNFIDFKTNAAIAPRDYALYPDFFSVPEQTLLLSAALQKLNSAESARFRKRRRTFESAIKHDPSSSSMQSLFLPDEFYEFQQGHYDGVIHNYREMHVSSWPDIPELPPLLARLRQLHPDVDTQTHLLHLASDGEILPHVDNVEASGTWILGVSLGAERVMRIESVEESGESFDILLPSGSVYLQKDSVRFQYKHSIWKKASFKGRHIEGGQRVSIMVRDLLRTTDGTHTLSNTVA